MTDHTRGSYKHFVRVPTRWRDNDAYGHVNNAVYYEFFDTVINSCLIADGGLDFIDGEVVGLAVETHCEFRKSISYPQDIDAGLRVAKIGTSSVRYEVGLFIAGDDVCAAHGHFVHVFVKRPENKPTPIPAQLRALFEKLLAG